MKANTNLKSSNHISGAKRPFDVYFPLYNQYYPTAGNRVILTIFMLALYFGVIGLIWIIPFPQPKWMGHYNGYFSWASIFIAAIMYYWYKQSPILSYFLLILLFVLSYAAAQTAEMAALIGPPMVTICLPIVLASLISLYIIMRKRPTGSFLLNLVRLPVWLAGFLGRAFGARL